MTKGKYGYKIDVLRKMLEAEENPDGGYGARLHMGDLPPLTIDADAIRALIDHYDLKNGRK